MAISEKKHSRQEAEQALIPSTAFVADMAKEVEKEVPKMEDEAKALVDMTETEGWKVLKKYVEAKKKRLLGMTQESVRSKKYEFQNIGFAFLIFDQISNALDDVVRYVESPRKILLNKKQEEEEIEEMNEL